MATIFLANNEKEFDREHMDAAFANEVYEFDFEREEVEIVEEVNIKEAEKVSLTTKE